MFDEMIETVKAALQPGADDATKQKAVVILRGVLGLLEPGPPAATSTPPAPGTPDVLALIVERIRPLLPPEVLETMPRFRVPLVGVDANGPGRR